MSKKEAIFLFTIVIVFASGFYYYMKHVFKPRQLQDAEVAAAVIGENPKDTAATTNRQVWELPKELKEISSNVFVAANRMACVQDNDGIIFIYNLQTLQIDERIEFAGNGDYEGLVRTDQYYYVLRSDGLLYEIQYLQGKKPVVKTYELPLKRKNETESVAYDKVHNRLLVAVKTKDLYEKDKKGIYGFDLNTKQMSTKAVCYIESFVDGEAGGKKKEKKKQHLEIKPSEIALHPTTGELYILDGPSSRLFIADATGAIKSKIQLDKKLLPQPEGLCFNAQGELYISSEAAKNEHGVIVKFK